MNIPTPADPVMEMARKIAQDIEGDRDGSYSNQVYLGALAAIRATTEAAAALAQGYDTWTIGLPPVRVSNGGSRLAAALRANKHIKGSDDV